MAFVQMSRSWLLLPSVCLFRWPACTRLPFPHWLCCLWLSWPLTSMCRLRRYWVWVQQQAPLLLHLTHLPHCLSFSWGISPISIPFWSSSCRVISRVDVGAYRSFAVADASSRTIPSGCPSFATWQGCPSCCSAGTAFVVSFYPL